MVVCGVGYQLQFYQHLCIRHGVDGLMSYYLYSFSGGLFVRIRIDYSYHYSVPKRIFGTALIIYNFVTIINLTCWKQNLQGHATHGN